MPAVRNSGHYGCPQYNQATKIIRKFGGEANLARLLGVSRISLYRWQYKRPYGCDGLIPTRKIQAIKAVARHEGVLLRDEDWRPDQVRWDAETRTVKPKRPSRKRTTTQTTAQTPAATPTLEDLLA